MTDEPKYASVAGVQHSDITRNLMVAVVEEIGAGRTVHAIATFTAFLQAIGYSEYAEVEDVTKCCPTHCSDWCLDKGQHTGRLCCQAPKCQKPLMGQSTCPTCGSKCWSDD